MVRWYDYIYILATIVFTVYGQLILKWRISSIEQPPADFIEKMRFVLLLLFDPVILSGIFAAFLASLAWMAAMTKFELGHAYPFMSLNFVLVVLLSNWFLSEGITFQKILGIGLIVLGTVVATRS